MASAGGVKTQSSSIGDRREIRLVDDGVLNAVGGPSFPEGPVHDWTYFRVVYAISMPWSRYAGGGLTIDGKMVSSYDKNDHLLHSFSSACHVAFS